jgi:hypothetical protein
MVTCGGIQTFKSDCGAIFWMQDQCVRAFKAGYKTQDDVHFSAER